MNSTIKLFGIFMITATIVACGSKNDIEAKKQELKQAKEQLIEVQNKIAELEKSLESDSVIVENSYTPVRVAKVNSGEFNSYVKVHGAIEASNNILINPEAGGTIISIKVSEGQKVAKGQIIAELDASDLDKAIAELKISLGFATTMFNKQQELKDKNIGTEVQYLEAKNGKESLEKKLESLQAQRDHFVVRSPIDGIVDDIMPKIGEMAAPQFPIARVVNLEKVYVEAEISEALLGKVNEGDYVSVEFRSINFTTRGKIVSTGNFINPSNRTYKIKVELDDYNKLLKPNLLSILKLRNYHADSALAVPTTVIQEDLKGIYVYLVEEGKATKRYVELGNSNNDSTVVVSGLKLNDAVIIEGFRGLANGELVDVK